MPVRKRDMFFVVVLLSQSVKVARREDEGMVLREEQSKAVYAKSGRNSFERKGVRACVGVAQGGEDRGLLGECGCWSERTFFLLLSSQTFRRSQSPGLR